MHFIKASLRETLNFSVIACYVAAYCIHIASTPSSCRFPFDSYDTRKLARIYYLYYANMPSSVSKIKGYFVALTCSYRMVEGKRIGEK
jgi:hypothetical protein